MTGALNKRGNLGQGHTQREYDVRKYKEDTTIKVFYMEKYKEENKLGGKCLQSPCNCV